MPLQRRYVCSSQSSCRFKVLLLTHSLQCCASWNAAELLLTLPDESMTQDRQDDVPVCRLWL